MSDSGSDADAEVSQGAGAAGVDDVYSSSRAALVGVEDTPSKVSKEEALEALKPDLCITAAYGCFLPQRFLDAPKHGTLNIHPSLLPLYRGAAPVQRSLENGDAVTGVSVAFTVLAMDAGPLVRQEERERQ